MKIILFFNSCAFSMFLVAALFVLTGCERDSGSSDLVEGIGTQDADSGWRDGRDLDVIEASGNAVEWETRNIQAPATLNLPGDCEWIIARIEGQGYRRLLIMTMHTSGGARSPSRIYFEGPGSMTDGRFSVPLPGPSHWRVESSGGALRVFLDGREIWSAAGNYGVTRAIMTDSGVRGFLGEWRPVR